jgi:hypothetical protein
MAVWCTFLTFELVGSGVAARSRLQWLFGALKIQKSAPKGHYYQQRAVIPDQITQQNSLQRARRQ